MASWWERRPEQDPIGGRARVRRGSDETWTRIPGTLNKNSRIDAQTRRRCSHRGIVKVESKKIALLTSSKDHIVTTPKIVVLTYSYTKDPNVTGYSVLVSFLSQNT